MHLLRGMQKRRMVRHRIAASSLSASTVLLNRHGCVLCVLCCVALGVQPFDLIFGAYTKKYDTFKTVLEIREPLRLNDPASLQRFFKYRDHFNDVITDLRKVR